jgi:hypothetical protein
VPVVLRVGDAVAQEDPQQRPEQAPEEHRALPGLPHVRRQEAAPPAVHELLQEGHVLRLGSATAGGLAGRLCMF